MNSSRIRVATVRHAQEFGLPPAPDGMRPTVILNAVHDLTTKLVHDQYNCWNQVLCPALASLGVGVLSHNSWNVRQKRWLRGYFRNEIMPVLSPLGLDPAHPFPKIFNKTLNIVVVLNGIDAFGRAGHLAIVVPRVRCRVMSSCPQHLSRDGSQHFVFLSSSTVCLFVGELFPGIPVVKGAYQFPGYS